MAFSAQQKMMELEMHVKLRDRTARTYRQIAPKYDSLHGRWLRYAGGGAQAAFEAAVLMRIKAGDRVLDAGCGTGLLARRILACRPDVDLTLVDACPEMIAQAADLPAARVEGSLLNLPFTDNYFDIVTAAWSIEATENPALALRELRRVLKPGGNLVLVFCSDAPAAIPFARVMRWSVKLRHTGKFLSVDAVDAFLTADDAGQTMRLHSLGPATAMIFTKSQAREPLAACA